MHIKQSKTMIKTIVLSTILVLLSFHSVQVDAATLHVPSVYATIQDAVDTALDGDIVVLADGIYTGDGNKNLNFMGKAISLRSENGPENCIIDLENNGRAFIMTSEEPDTVISGLTVKNGYMQRYGGAVYLSNASPTIQNCIFTENTVYASSYFAAGGGAIFMRGTSSPDIVNCLFYRNQAIGYYEEGDDPEYSYGSAIFCEDESSPRIVNCTIVFNTGDHEAAVYSEETSPFIGNSIIWGNIPANISTGNGDLWDAQYNNVEGDYPGVGNFHGDPLFMDADNDDYWLSISSPCIYAASGDTAPAEDILGVERPAGAAPDIGAYEATGYSTTRPVVDFFTADQDEGETPFPVNFSCQASDVDGLITAYTMDFGDGSETETNTSGIFSHTYSSGGIFFVHCTVRDDAGIEIRTTSITLKVHEIRKVPSQYATIQEAIDAALDEDIVQLADGIYTGEGNKNLNFNGKPLTLRSENGPENCIIDCEGEGRGFIFESNEDNRSVVSGISIINGNEEYGGAIYSIWAMPLIRNCILSNNTATYGGAIRVRIATLDNCRMFNNSARYGGALYFSADEGNSAVTNCEFESNVAEEYGGAIYTSGDGNCPISGCTFYRNSAEGSGGAIYTHSYGRVDVSQSIFVENNAGSAGAVRLGEYGSSVVNCIFSKNTADVGGAIIGYDTEDLIANCTFYKNTATIVGGAIRTYIYNSYIPTLTNNIFWENSPNHIQADGRYEPDVTYSCIQGGYTGEGNFHGDPLFVDPENLDFHLQTHSPCMYAGTAEGAPDIDFEGNPRPQGYGYDLGAYETNGYELNRPIIDSFTSDSVEGELPFDVSFSGSAHDTDGTIVSYTIDYGDGTPPETNETGNFVHTYTSIGYGDAFITVIDDSGAAANSHSILIKRYGSVHVPSEYTTIQNAVDALLDGNTIVVEDGVYTGEGNTNINVYGKSLTIKSLNGPENCIIDCQGAGRGFIFENGETEETVISGFTIINGNGYAQTTTTGSYSGGGIYCYGASPTIDNCIVKGNTAIIGGGFYCDESSPIITNCFFLENTSSSGGGGLFFDDSTVSMDNCIVRKNTSEGYGGGLASSYTNTPTSIANCIIADNSAGNAGGIYASGFYELFTIVNCTITGNTAYSSGGGILCEGDLSLNISNSILWDNAPDEIWSSTYNTLVVRYSDVQGGYEGTGIIDTDPLFGADYHLQAGSPCRNAGDPFSASPQFPEHDIDGEDRPQGSIYDIGSDEFYDSDGDELPDYWEYKWFGDLSHDEDTNSDTDTLTDLEEFQNATNPSNPDSDDDGLFDGDEVNTYGTDPNVFDNDNAAPTSPSLNQPAEGAEVPTLIPILSVNNSSDPEAQTVDYNFELYADASLNELIASAENVEEGDGTTAWALDFNLEDHTTYHWRSRAFDGHNPSDWMKTAQFFINTANEAPGAPVASTPVDGSSVAVLQPTLTVTNADNADQDALSYEFEVYSDDAMLEPVTSTDGILEGSVETSWQVDTALTDNTWYWWQARARDDEDVAGEWSDLQSVFINTANNAPVGLTISSPGDGEEMTSLDVTLEINNAVDPEGVSVTYDFQIDTADTFSSAGLQEAIDLEEGTGGVTSWSLYGLSDNTLYYWRARAYDGEVYGAWVAGSFFVNLSNDIPTAPGIASPGYGSQVVSTAPTLSVIPASDPDMDTLTYTFEVYDDGMLTSIVVSESGVEAATWQTLGYLDNYSTYYWRACATDEHGTQGPWSETAMFTVFVAPEAPTINSPSNGGVVDEDVPTLSVINGLAAGDEPLTYIFEIYADKNLTELVDAEGGVPEGDTLTSYTVVPTLENETTYYWRVKASDGVLESSWTSTAVFLVALDVYEVKRDVAAYSDMSASSTETQVVTVSDNASDLAGTTVEIPAGALDEDVTIIISEVTNPPDLPDDVISLGVVVDFGPDGLQFDQAVTIRIPYSQDLMDAVGVTDPNDLSVWTYNTSERTWEKIEVDSVDAVNMVIVCSTTHFSIYRVAALVTSDNDSSDTSGDDGGGGGCFISNTLSACDHEGCGYWIGLGAIFSMILVLGVYRRRRD